MSISIGTKGRAETVVTQQDTAAAMGSGQLSVLATPRMLALMENAAYTCLTPYLAKGEDTVGTRLDVSHTAATPVGVKVWAEATVTEVVGGRVTFEVAAWDEYGEIGRGVHTRFIIEPERFLQKARQKLKQ